MEENIISAAQLVADETCGLIKELIECEEGHELDAIEKRFTETDIAMAVLAGAINACGLAELMDPTFVKNAAITIAKKLNLFLPPEEDEEDEGDE